MKRIAIEEHFTTEEHLDSLVALVENKTPLPEAVLEENMAARDVPFLRHKMRKVRVSKLLNIGEGRLREMDSAGIDMQVLSLVSPGIQLFDATTAIAMAKKVNEKLSEAVKKYPRRFAGLASIAPQDPQAAAEELERAVKQLGLRGVTINSHTNGEYLDNKKYWGIFEEAEKLDVPIYLHPRVPSPDMVKPYLGYAGLDGAMLGFAHEVALHALRLICSGLFDEYPKLRIILGHLGESLPYWLWRIDNKMPASLAGTLKKNPSQYVKDNFYVTTSGMFWQPPLVCAYQALGADRILFAVDYPMESNEDAVRWMDAAPICNSDKEKIYYLNAGKLLKL